MILDHVVIAVSDLERAIEDYRALGFTVAPGGDHPHRPSRNALIAFDDGAYIELLGFRAPAPGDRWYETFEKHGEGLMDFALLPEDVPQAIVEAKSRGLALAGPQDGGRKRPDGREIRWQTARPSTCDLPFLCGDVTPRDDRVPGGDACRHANGAIGIAGLTVAVHDPEVTLRRYEALLGRIERTESGLRLGETTITLIRTRRARGEGPVALRVRTGATHGVALELAP
jgi:catechol 2,3-dioxygenase-like lactoylglutathione lyase family enzyme